MSGRGGRKLRPEDAALWARVAQSVERMPGKPSPEELRRMVDEALDKSASGGKARAAAPGRQKLKGPAAPPPPRAGAAAQPHPPSAGSLDRRSRQRMARGNVNIEARLDLHGMGAQEAHAQLKSFLAQCRARGLRTVLVITGKGASPYARHTLHGHEHWHAPERKGRLRRLVPQWLHEHGFAHHVAGFQPAHPRHGGGGAFYIRLRRKDRGLAP